MCTKNFNGKDWACNKTCPMYSFEVCSKPTDKYPTPLEIGDDLAHEIECVIMTWAAEHPEPVYPSVAEYLERLGIIIRRDGTMEADFFKANEPMNADVAKLLGLEPKEGE